MGLFDAFQEILLNNLELVFLKFKHFYKTHRTSLLSFYLFIFTHCFVIILGISNLGIRNSNFFVNFTLTFIVSFFSEKWIITITKKKESPHHLSAMLFIFTKYIPFTIKCFLSSQYFQIWFMQGSLVIITTTDDCYKVATDISQSKIQTWYSNWYYFARLLRWNWHKFSR